MVNYQFTQHPNRRVVVGNLGRNRFGQNKHLTRNCRDGWKPLPVQVGDYPGGYTTVRCYPETGKLTNEFHTNPNSVPWFMATPINNQKFARGIGQEELTAAANLQRLRNNLDPLQPFKRIAVGIPASQAALFHGAPEPNALGIHNGQGLAAPAPVLQEINNYVVNDAAVNAALDFIAEDIFDANQIADAVPIGDADNAQPGAEVPGVQGQGEPQALIPAFIPLNEHFANNAQQPIVAAANVHHTIDALGQETLAPNPTTRIGGKATAARLRREQEQEQEQQQSTGMITRSASRRSATSTNRTERANAEAPTVYTAGETAPSSSSLRYNLRSRPR